MWQANESGNRTSNVKGYIERYNLDSSEKKEKKGITSSKKNVCPTVMLYLEKITILAGDYEVETKKVKLTLYQLNSSKTTSNLDPVLNSKHSSLHIKLKNSVCASYKDDGIVVVSVLDQLTQLTSNRMTFHLFSQTKTTTGKNWKMASLLLPTVLHNPESCKYQIQSCVVISDHLYCSLWLHETTVYIYEIDLSPLNKYNKEYYEDSLPERSWVIEGLFIQSCFLCILEEKVVATVFKDMNDKTVMEIKLIDSVGKTGKPYRYAFSSVMKVITVSLIVPNTIAIVYHDDTVKKCCAIRFQIPANLM